MARKTIAEVLKANPELMARMTLTTRHHLDGDFDFRKSQTAQRKANKAKKLKEKAKLKKQKQEESWLKIKKKTV